MEKYLHDFLTFEVNYLKNYSWLRKSDNVFEFIIQKQSQILGNIPSTQKMFENAYQCNTSPHKQRSMKLCLNDITLPLLPTS